MFIKNRIKEICRQKRISGYRLAQIIGCNKSHIYKVWSNKYGVSLEMAKQLAKALEVKIDYLFYIPSSDNE